LVFVATTCFVVALLSFVSLVAFLALLSISLLPVSVTRASLFHLRAFVERSRSSFFLLFVYAIDQLSSWTKREWVRWTLLGAIVLFLTVSQLQVNAPAFSSRYNLFHRKSL
jgi:hypothetical protein